MGLLAIIGSCATIPLPDVAARIAKTPAKPVSAIAPLNEEMIAQPSGELMGEVASAMGEMLAA